MKKNENNRMKVFFEGVKFPLLAVLLSFIVGAIFILLAGKNPVVAYYELFRGSLGSIPRVGETLLMSTPLIFTGLAVSFAFRSGLFNIGAEGQYLIGAISTVAAGYYFGAVHQLPAFILVPLVILIGALGGALWAGIAGYLKARLGIHEVITTIMLNYTSLHVSNYFVRTALNPATLQGTAQRAHTVLLPEAARLTRFRDILPSVFQYSSVNTSILIAIGCAFLAYFILFKTTLGYELRSVGHNPLAAEYGGINISKNLVLSMLISGALAGLAGATQIAGLVYKVDMAPASPGYGFTGIAVALVGKNHPLGVILSAILFGVLNNGARKMQIAGIPKDIVGIIQGVIIIFIAGDQIIKYITKLRKEKNNDPKEVA